ncbi:SDR family oxidoreductase [Hymenobacter latericus]|uniref:SDR family oxidoreductase n=1 Tax=Hymenobacter sp. YIM 151858-1 TaxID=2987688 RepID=UPI002226DBF6|nr:SDR family oxidoreductase [Hymenobacter sp. YIM 151858-1]UYZ59056.1 SDR family oxidoreductase [Hymenobacter sp. YIM 151858-1]
MAETILVTGATGTVGSELVRALITRGAHTRAAVHSIIKGDRLRHFNPEIQLVEVDYHRPATLPVAFTGVDRVFLLTPFSDDQLAINEQLVEAAKAAGVKQVVRLSAAGADAEPGIQLGRWHRQMEQYLAQSGLSYTVLRPTSFMQNFVNYQGQSIREQGAIYLPLGEGRMSYIDAFDIAEVAATILTDPDVARHHGQAYTLTGPQALGHAEIASIIGQATGRPVQYVDVPEHAARQAMQGAPQWMVDSMMELNALGKAGHLAGTTSAVEQLTGRPPRTFQEFAQEHRHAFVAE